MRRQMHYIKSEVLSQRYCGIKIYVMYERELTPFCAKPLLSSGTWTKINEIKSMALTTKYGVG